MSAIGWNLLPDSAEVGAEGELLEWSYSEKAVEDSTSDTLLLKP